MYLSINMSIHYSQKLYNIIYIIINSILCFGMQCVISYHSVQVGLLYTLSVSLSLSRVFPRTKLCPLVSQQCYRVHVWFSLWYVRCIKAVKAQIRSVFVHNQVYHVYCICALFFVLLCKVQSPLIGLQVRLSVRQYCNSTYSTVCTASLTHYPILQAVLYNSRYLPPFLLLHVMALLDQASHAIVICLFIMCRTHYVYGICVSYLSMAIAISHLYIDTLSLLRIVFCSLPRTALFFFD